MVTCLTSVGDHETYAVIHFYIHTLQWITAYFDFPWVLRSFLCMLYITPRGHFILSLEKWSARFVSGPSVSHTDCFYIVCTFSYCFNCQLMSFKTFLTETNHQSFREKYIYEILQPMRCIKLACRKGNRGNDSEVFFLMICRTPKRKRWRIVFYLAQRSIENLQEKS